MNDDNTSQKKLMSDLKNLYGKLSALLTGIRMRSYHVLTDSKNSFDITSVLNKQVDEYVAQHQPEKRLNSIQADKEEPGNVATIKSEAKLNNDMLQSQSSGTESAFAKHLKHRESSSVSQPRMGDNLKASAWEHIHKAIRFAKQGEVENAKLHTNIAGQALEEAGHYLNDKDYADLVFEIENYFTDTK